MKRLKRADFLYSENLSETVLDKVEIKPCKCVPNFEGPKSSLTLHWRGWQIKTFLLPTRTFCIHLSETMPGCQCPASTADIQSDVSQLAFCFLQVKEVDRNEFESATENVDTTVSCWNVVAYVCSCWLQSRRYVCSHVGLNVVMWDWCMYWCRCGYVYFNVVM